MIRKFILFIVISCLVNLVYAQEKDRYTYSMYTLMIDNNSDTYLEDGWFQLNDNRVIHYDGKDVAIMYYKSEWDKFDDNSVGIIIGNLKSDKDDYIMVVTNKNKRPQIFFFMLNKDLIEYHIIYELDK